MLGPILFIAYSAEVIGIVEQHGFNVHAFADDLQVYGHAAQNEAAHLATRMSTCIESVKAWMSSNRLRLNPSKTELIWLGSSRRLHHCSSTGMRVSDVDLRPVDCVRDLGVLIDSGTTLARYVNHISSVCLFQLRQLRIIRRSLTTDVAHALVRALIHTRIDYCNGLLASCPRYLTDKLRVVLRAAARMVLQLPYRSSVSEVMHRQLHWLDVVDRVNYKIGLLNYKCLHGLAPGYLSNQFSAFRLQFSPVVPTCAHPRAWTDFCTSHERKQRHWVHEGSTTPRLPCGTRSRWTCAIPDSRSTPSEQN